MKKALKWLNNHWLKVVTGVVLFIVAFALIPFERNWKLFFLLALVGIGAWLLNMYDPTPAKLMKPANGVKVLSWIAAGMLLFGFFLPKIGEALWAKTQGLYKTTVSALAKPSQILPAMNGATTSISKRIAIKQDAWSEWVSVPEGWDFRVRDESGAPIDVKFWDGRIVSDRPESGTTPETKWEGVVKNCSFQIRRISGEGVALVTMTH